MNQTMKRGPRHRAGVQVQVILDPAVKQGVRELAAKDAITMAAWLDRLIAGAVKAAGYPVE